jgi:hypothetical protein
MVRLTILHVVGILVVIWPSQTFEAELTEMEQEFQLLKENFVRITLQLGISC